MLSLLGSIEAEIHGVDSETSTTEPQTDFEEQRRRSLLESWSSSYLTLERHSSRNKSGKVRNVKCGVCNSVRALAECTLLFSVAESGSTALTTTVHSSFVDFDRLKKPPSPVVDSEHRKTIDDWWRPRSPHSASLPFSKTILASDRTFCQM